MRSGKDMASKNNSSTGFKSIIYRSGYVYNFVNQRMYDFKKKFKSIATIINRSGSKTVLDLPCGTGYLTRYLDPKIVQIYEGYDRNRKFIVKIRKDWNAGRIKLNKVVLQQKDIFDFSNYPKEKKDVIVFCDILHHVYPRHIDLVENAKKHAKKIIICEPIAVRPQDVSETNDWIARITVFLTKFLPEKLYKYVDYFLADNDGINSFKNRSSWNYDDVGLKGLYTSMGIKKIYNLGDDYIGVWDEKS